MGASLEGTDAQMKNFRKSMQGGGRNLCLRHLRRKPGVLEIGARSVIVDMQGEVR